MCGGGRLGSLTTPSIGLCLNGHLFMEPVKTKIHESAASFKKVTEEVSGLHGVHHKTAAETPSLGLFNHLSFPA